MQQMRAAQNGDLMRDPELVFEIRPAASVPAAEPLSFPNDFTGTHQEVYLYSPCFGRPGFWLLMTSLGELTEQFRTSRSCGRPPIGSCRAGRPRE